MDHTEPEDEAHLTVLFRDKTMQIRVQKNSLVRELGEKLLKLTGVAPHTMRLVLPASKRISAAALSPFAEQFSTSSLEQVGVNEGQVLRMVGACAKEIDDMETLSTRERIVGFKEEDERARKRSGYVQKDLPLPSGPYVFNEFRTLHLPQIELNPPPSKALDIMHKLARDPGIVAIMKKHRWTVGVMTEMAPVGYVGISPKCLLGYNKNRGEEISLRLRTDDLKGFRKYESIKKTLLHELAHMVHDEHDESFHDLDKQLNEEAVALDWTRSMGHSWGGLKSYEPEVTDSGGVQGSQSHRLGGKISANPSEAAAEAALLRFKASGSRVTPGKEILEEREDSMDLDRGAVSEEGIVVIAKGYSKGSPPDFDAAESSLCREAAGSGMQTSIPRNQNSDEPDPDDKANMTLHENSESDPDDMLGVRHEPDPDDTMGHERSEPDPDDTMGHERSEPDPDDTMGHERSEPDPDDTMGHERSEPDPDDTMGHERSEPDPDDSLALRATDLNVCDEGPRHIVVQSDSGSSSAAAQTQEPDTDYSTCTRSTQNEQLSPGAPAATQTGQSPYPGGSSMGIGEIDSETGMELRRIQQMTAATSVRLQEAIEKFMQQAGPSKAIMTAQTLSKILRNVCEHPNETKFRRLRKGNPTFMQLVGQYEGALDFLTAVGFKEAGEPGVLVLKRDDPGLLWLARSSLDAACTA